MSSTVRAFVAASALLALGACDGKPDRAAPPPQLVCNPAVPGAEAIAQAIHAMMVQIYGVDEVSATFKISAVNMADCKHGNVVYGAGASVRLVLGAGGKWQLSAYGKQYAVP